ncbi:MAG: DUF932 domain-containing protein, partial [Planctomycetes bacterium]|nr:DUF932 domain-containing protein [Planctomycetota bacterium]
WLRQDDNRELLLRCDGDQARAVLSPRYQRVDNIQLVEMLGESFGDDTPLRYELSESQLVIQFVDASDAESPSRGDLLHSGINIRNSEVGLSSIEVGGLVYRTICLNGLILNARGQSWRRRHIGKVDLAEDLRNAVANAQAQSREVRSTFASTTEIVVPQPLEAIERVVQHFQLTEAQSDAIKWGYNIEPGKRLYDIVNSVTRGAQNETLPLDARRQLQEVGGKMLTLAKAGHSWLG